MFSVFNCTLQGVIPPLKSCTVPFPTWYRHTVRAMDSTCLFPAVFLGCCVLHVQTRLLWVSSGRGDTAEAGGDGDGSVLQLGNALDQGLSWSAAYLRDLGLGACSRRKVMLNELYFNKALTFV